MSINPRQWIVQTLYNDLNKIKVINGYNYDIQEVYKNYINPENIPIPAIWFELIAESKNNESESRRFFNSQLTILIGAYTSIPNNELRNVADCSEKMIADLMACINKVKLQSSTLDTFPSKIKWDIKSIEPYLNPELQGIVENRIFVNIEYLDSPDIISRLNNDLPNTPIISTPLNGATVTTLYPQFQWDSVSGALSYQIHISSDNSFNSIYINQNYLTDNSYTIPLDKVLTNSNTYYVRVRAYNNVGYSDWSSTVSFSASINTTPATPILISPTASLTSNSIVTDFNWYLANNATSYDILVSSATDFSVTSFSSNSVNSTSITANLSANGNYYWKVRGRNTGGVGSYSSSANFYRDADANDYRTNLLVNWVADSNVVASAGLVSRWTDTVSGLTATQTGASTLQPLINTGLTAINGHNAVLINTALQYMTFPATQFTNYTIFVVAKPAIHTSGDGNVLLGGSAGDIYTSLRLVNTGFGTGDGTLLRNAAFTGSTTSIIWNIYTFQSSKLYRNNVEPSYVYTQAPTAITLNVLGARNTSKTFPWFGEVAEIRIYNAVLDSTNVTKVNNYLNNKYRIY